jgi:hypothetical protein
MSEYSDSPWCEPNTLLFRDVFLVVFGDKKVSPIPESHVEICRSWPVHASNCHVTMCILRDKGTLTSKMLLLPYRWFRYTLLVPKAAWVHFLNLKPLVCKLISTRSTWDIGTKHGYVLPQGFDYLDILWGGTNPYFRYGFVPGTTAAAVGRTQQPS